MRTAFREIQYAVRRLRASPMFTIAATLTLAIAIGATASVFSVVDAVMLKAFPFREPDRVLAILQSNPGLHIPRYGVTVADYIDWQEQSHAFAQLAAAEFEPVTVSGTAEPERVTGGIVTPSYFPVLGITPVLGRSLAADSGDGGPAEVVISYDYWQRRYGGARSVLGRTIRFDNQPYTIVGVVPAGWPGSTELWSRLTFKSVDRTNRALHAIAVVYGRLKPGVTQESGRRELETIAQRLAESYPETNRGWTVATLPLLDQWLGRVRAALIMLLAASAAVLLIGAANLANLFLVRCLAREREMAMRTALGATRGRLVRELLTEAAVLGLFAGALGVGVAFAAVPALRTLAPPFFPRLNQVGVDIRVVAFCALASLVTVVIFGALPAWRTSRGNLAELLKEGGRATGSAQRYGMQDTLVVLQVAVALVLMTGAGLLVGGFDHLRRVDPGIRPEGVLTAEIDMPNPPYATPERQAAFARSVVERLATEPGVIAASASDFLPGLGGALENFFVAGDPAPPPGQVPTAWAIGISPDYFRTMGITLLRGRAMLPSDDIRAVRVALVDEMLAERFFGGRDPIGHRLTFAEVPDTLEIVGLVTHVKQGGPTGEERPEIYASYAQYPIPVAYISVRTSSPIGAATRMLKQAVASLDRTVPVSDVQTMSDRVMLTVGTTRFSSLLASLFALVALILGAVGIYSVLSYIVGQRRREIAVRMALGANRAQVMDAVLRRALALTGLGITIGSGAAWVVTRVLASLFLGVDPHDPGVFVGAAATFAVVALAAASVPAFRTTRVDPVVALTSA
jgi:putative ABC transport system permease protein